MAKTIIQASDLKQSIEKMNVTTTSHTLASVDAEACYPSVRLKLVRKAVHCCSKDLSEEDKNKIEDCLDMIKFGMSNAPLTFVDKCYECDGAMDTEEKGLTVGGYESAWLADLVGAYTLDDT